MYDERQQPNSSGSLVAVIGVGLVLGILGIVVVAGAALFWVRASTQQAQVATMEQQAMVAIRTEVEARRAVAMAQLEQSGVAETPDPRLNFVLEIDREGNVTTADARIGLDKLRAEIAKLKDETSNVFRVRINADPDCPIKFVVPVLEVLDEVGDIDYRIMSSDSSGVRMTAIVASYEPAAEWDHFDDGTFSAYDTITLQVVAPERHKGTTISLTVPPTEFPENAAFRAAGTRFTFTVRESDIGATGLAWGAIDDPAIEQ